jgi:hypothetical protein
MFVVICALCICFDLIYNVCLSETREIGTQSVPMVEIIPDRPDATTGGG